MSALAEAEEAERRIYGEKVRVAQLLRKDRVKRFLNFRALNSQDRAEWSELMEQDVTLTLPITPYRYFPRREIAQLNRVVRGLDEVLVDNASLALLAECIGQGSPQWRQAIKQSMACKIEFEYPDAHLLCAGDRVMCKYSMHITNCERVGGPPNSSCTQHGMLQCTFNPVSEKIQTAEFVFDVMNFMQQLQVFQSPFFRI
uniref:Uncharacterized protein n=1 Tax=Spumella elongata TaxID=89044 RepID=A0A7S3M7F2_9STRA